MEHSHSTPKRTKPARKPFEASTSAEIVELSSDDSPIKVERAPIKVSPSKFKVTTRRPKAPPKHSVMVVNADHEPFNDESTFNVIFDDKLVALSTANDPTLQRVKQAVLTRNSSLLKTKEPYFFRAFGHLHVKAGCLFYDNRLIVPNCLQQAILHRLHEDHSGAHAMLARASNIWWPHMRREIRLKAQGCTDCSYAGKNLKPLIPMSPKQIHFASLIGQNLNI